MSRYVKHCMALITGSSLQLVSAAAADDDNDEEYYDVLLVIIVIHIYSLWSFLLSFSLPLPPSLPRSLALSLSLSPSRAIDIASERLKSGFTQVISGKHKHTRTLRILCDLPWWMILSDLSSFFFVIVHASPGPHPQKAKAENQWKSCLRDLRHCYWHWVLQWLH